MNTYTELLLLALVVDYVVGLSGWSDSLKGWLSRRLGRRVVDFRPFTCSQCMTWWAGLLWAALQGALTLPVVAYIAGLAFFSNTFEQVLIFIREAALTALRKISDKWL